MPLPNAETPEEREAEDCVRFVAVTRAKRKLVFVESEDARDSVMWWRDLGTCQGIGVESYGDASYTVGA